jgi:hypothetical protein
VLKRSDILSDLVFEVALELIQRQKTQDNRKNVGDILQHLSEILPGKDTASMEETSQNAAFDSDKALKINTL